MSETRVRRAIVTRLLSGVSFAALAIGASAMAQDAASEAPAAAPSSVPHTRDGSGAPEPPYADAAPVAVDATGAAGSDLSACDAPPPSGFVCVPGARFTRGVADDDHRCRQSGQPHDRHSSSVPASTVSVSTFWMARTETTNAAFAACQEAGACDEDAGPRYRDFDAPEQPVTGISWYDAVDYCTWLGGHLPTEAEWELAARGPDGELNPWGDAPADCDLAVIRDERGRSCGVERRGSTPETGRVLEPCTRGEHRGLCDMAGNAEEWTLDAWTRDWETCGDDCAGVDPRGPCDGAPDCDGHAYRVVRGGSWYWPSEHATGAHRRRHYPGNDPYHHFGFRCAMSLEEAAAAATPNVGGE